MNCSEAVAYGAVQGISEFLPVSSSAHLMILGAALNRGDCESAWYFDLSLQFASALAVVVIYSRRILQLLCGLLGKSREGLRLAALLFIAFLPGAICGAAMDAFNFGRANSIGALGWPLIGGGIYLIFFEKYRRRRRGVKKLSNITVADAIFIGAMQAVALIPGVSRSLMSLSACLFIGLAIPNAVEFSFLLGAETISAAVCYEFLKGNMMAMGSIPLCCTLCGALVAFFFAFPAIKFLRYLLVSNAFISMAYYRIVLGALLLSHFYFRLT
ncbi:MAG: undecaprenyl-diphosphate phosphatase [Puniceicoccales bacterium]|nr:undecaprenyl-diphosphate phosphatase [Puniceicoccales bacterium]